MLKIAILGDSISEGLGSRKYNYINHIQNNIPKSKIKNFAYTGTTIDYALKISEEILKFNPDIVLIFYGNVDAILRPDINNKPNIYKLLPKRYKKNGMLDPRPYYSGGIVSRIIQKVESNLRYNIKKILIKIQGSYAWTDIDKFKRLYDEFLYKIDNKERYIFLISTVTIDEKYFPGSNENFIKYNDVIKKIANSNNKIFIDLYSELKKYEWDYIYGNDHFHPNLNGYKIIGDFLSDKIKEHVFID